MDFKFNNPFLISFIIVIVLNVMVYVFFRPAVKSKVYFRGIFYMYVVTTGIFYLHHKKMENDMQAKLNTNLAISDISGPTVGEMVPTIVGRSEDAPVDVFVEESLI